MSSQPPPMSRRFSEVLREKWFETYTEKIRKQGEADLEASIKFEKLEDFDITNQKTLQSNECILLFPKIQPRTGLEEDIEDIKNDGSSPTSKMNGKVIKTDFTAYRLPLLYPSVGYPCIDVRALKGKTGVTTYDPGFMSTSSCHSTITYIDGPNGRLLHRGYEIQELCDKSDFVDLSFLLLYGELPGRNDRIHHETQIKKHSLVHEKLIEV